jgi:hypothetical protein
MDISDDELLLKSVQERWYEQCSMDCSIRSIVSPNAAFHAIEYMKSVVLSTHNKEVDPITV